MSQNSKVVKLENKQIIVTDYKFVGKNIVKEDVPKSIIKKPFFKVKLKVIVCKLLNITPLEKYRFHIQIKYKGTSRIKHRDVLSDKVGNLYTVLEEKNRLARIMSYTPMTDKPNLYGKLNIEARENKEVN